MILWKERSRTTHRACSLSLALLLCLSCLPLYACGSSRSIYTVGAWHEDIVEYAGIQSRGDVTKDLIEYEVLRESSFDPNAELTLEWEAYTLVNLYGTDLSDTAIEESCASSKYPYHLSAAHQLGLISIEGKDPETTIQQEEAQKDLEHTVEAMNARAFAPVSKLQFSDDLVDVKDQVECFEEEEKILHLLEPLSLQNGTAVCFKIGSEEVFGRIVEQKDERTYRLQEIPIEELFTSIDLQGGFEVDFEHAEIQEEETESEHSLTYGFVPNHSISLMSASMHPLVRTRTIQGWKVKFQVTSTQVKAEVTKETGNGLTAFANVILNGLKPVYRWKMKDGKIEDAYFRCDFKTSENAGFRINDYKTLYGDLSAMDPHDLLGSVQSMFKQKSEMPVLDIPIATFTIPVPSAPLATIKVRLQLRVYSSARCELTFVQDHCIGMEIRNGCMRLIQDNTHNADAVLKGNTSLVAAVKIGLDLARVSLMDVTGEAGIKASLNTTMHIYEKDQETTVTSDVIPADLLEEVYPNSEKALFCTDIKAYAVSDLKLNSSNSVAGKLGFSRSFSILNEYNGSLFGRSSVHLENGKIVKACTRNGRVLMATSDPVHTERLELDQYDLSMVVSESTVLKVTKIPDGYSSSDLVFSIKDTDVAICNGTTITALKGGATIMTVSTADGKYAVSCMILVRESETV